jgi:hypothetical protein
VRLILPALVPNKKPSALIGLGLGVLVGAGIAGTVVTAWAAAAVAAG